MRVWKPTICFVYGEGGGGGVCAHGMHGRSRITIDPRVPTMGEGQEGACGNEIYDIDENFEMDKLRISRTQTKTQRCRPNINEINENS